MLGLLRRCSFFNCFFFPQRYVDDEVDDGNSARLLLRHPLSFYGLSHSAYRVDSLLCRNSRRSRVSIPYRPFGRRDHGAAVLTLLHLSSRICNIRLFAEKETDVEGRNSMSDRVSRLSCSFFYITLAVVFEKHRDSRTQITMPIIYFFFCARLTLFIGDNGA